MDVSIQHDHATATMNCPTCGAEQPQSDECRRCKSDLSELRAVWLASRQARTRCLRDLKTGDFHRALDHARRGAALNPDQDASRLLAVCHLLAGERRTALHIARACR